MVSWFLCSKWQIIVPCVSTEFGCRKDRIDFIRLSSIKTFFRKRYDCIKLGAYGEVRKGIHKLSNQTRAVKIISKERAKKAEIERLKEEVDILKKLVIILLI